MEKGTYHNSQFQEKNGDYVSIQIPINVCNNPTLDPPGEIHGPP